MARRRAPKREVLSGQAINYLAVREAARVAHRSDPGELLLVDWLLEFCLEELTDAIVPPPVLDPAVLCDFGGGWCGQFGAPFEHWRLCAKHRKVVLRDRARKRGSG